MKITGFRKLESGIYEIYFNESSNEEFDSMSNYYLARIPKQQIDKNQEDAEKFSKLVEISLRVPFIPLEKALEELL